MAVYVDDVRLRFGRMVMCHLWADSLDELFAMVDAIGVQRKWLQGHPTLSFGKHKNASWVHFDICVSKKAEAIRRGAILTDRFGPVEHVARLDLASGDEELAAQGRRRLAQIETIRGRVETGEQRPLSL
jgi:hypothetical protein